MNASVTAHGVGPTGHCFTCYRRSQAHAVAPLVRCLKEHGVPTWRDLDDLGSEPTVEALIEELDDQRTSAGVIWLSQDIDQSPVIQQEEAPRLLRRSREDDWFRTHLVLADGLDYPDVTRLLRMPGTFEDPARTRNIIKPPRGAAVRDVAVLVTTRVLNDRIADVHAWLPDGAPLKVRMNAHAHARAAFESGLALNLDWASRFQHRHADAAAWNDDLLPALGRVRSAIKAHCPGRGVVFDGQMTLSAGLALGRAFVETTGVRISWVQHPSGAVWSLASEREDSGLAARLQSENPAGKDLAVFVNVRADVEPAAVATRSVLPPFRAVLRIGPADGGASVHLDTPGKATHAAALIAKQIRAARHTFPVVERVHIFMAGPSGLAMMLGQLLNAVGPVHVYELDQGTGGVGMYRPALVLTDTAS